jgi:predicted enzyme related to lactoylglutathione lyase
MPVKAKKKTQAKATKRSSGRKASAAAPKAKKGAGDSPVFFRLNLEVGDLNRAVKFYETLLGVEGRVQAGSRFYMEPGPVTFQVVDVSSQGKPHPAAKALYFLVKDLDAVFERASALECLSREMIHGDPGGEIRVRPWGERSFYVEDPWDNQLCFVETGTTYPG